jgi:hypothetical protein
MGKGVQDASVGAAAAAAAAATVAAAALCGWKGIEMSPLPKLTLSTHSTYDVL